MTDPIYGVHVSHENIITTWKKVNPFPNDKF